MKDFSEYIKDEEEKYLNSRPKEYDLISINQAHTYFDSYKKQLILYGVSKRTSLIWKTVALFGIGYMLVDLIRYVC